MRQGLYFLRPYSRRTTETLPTKADVVIVGSGISGASAAQFLQQDGEGKKLNVVMLEAREECWGATGRNGGHFQPLIYANPPDVANFEIRNYEAVKELVESNHIECDWVSLSSVHTYMAKSMFEIAVEEAKVLHASDPTLAKFVTIVSKDSQNPSLEDICVPTAAGAIVQAKAASLWPYKLVSWILESLLSSKASEGSFNLQTNTPVTKLQKVEDVSWIVHTDRGMIAASKVLLTTNAYTSYLIPSFSDLIVPVRGEMSSLLPPKSTRPATTNEPLTYSYSFMGHASQNIDQDDYLVQRPFSGNTGGELMFGGGRSLAASGGVGVSDDTANDDSAAAYLRRELNVVLNLENDDEELKASWECSGIMGFSRDGRPWVGEMGDEMGGGKGLFVCAGFTGHGMPNARLCGKAVVDLLLGKACEDVDLPSSYRLGTERVTSARKLDEVAVADAKAGNIEVRPHA